MEANLYAQLSDKIARILSEKSTEMKSKVNQSMGSFFDKNDIYKLIDDTLTIFLEEHIKNVIADFIDKSNEEREEDTLYFSGDLIRKALESINFDSYVKVDNESAEFQLNYNNQIELVDVQYEIDSEEIIEEIDEQIMKLYKKEQFPKVIE